MSVAPEPLVSIGLPVRNGERYLSDAVRSVLEQQYDRLELVISDNASDDGTEEICREFARSDTRVRYHRQPQNIGLVPNFNAVLHLARGAYLKWLGDDDWLTPAFVPECVEVLNHDATLILVTTQQAHVGTDGAVKSADYDGSRMGSERPLERFTEALRLMNESYLLFDPLYGMMRRDQIACLARPVMLFEDQVFTARLALAGPFGHIGQVLSYRRTKPFPQLALTARRLGVPPWHARVSTVLQCRELLAAVREAELSPGDRRRANAAVAAMFLRRQQTTAVRRSRKVKSLASCALVRSSGFVSTPPKSH